MTDTNKPWTAGLTWHRDDSTRQVMLYTLMQRGWRRGQDVMVNDVTVTFQKANDSEADLEPIVSQFLAAPDMAEALANCVDVLDTVVGAVEGAAHAVKEARAALQKARGGES